MRNAVLVRLVLVLSGGVAAGIGLVILLTPHLLHSSSGLGVIKDVSLLNEMKSPAGMLLASGLFALVAAVRLRLARAALALSGVLYLSYGLSRLASILIDGLPSSQLQQAMGVELLIAAACLVLLWRNRQADEPAVH